MQFVQVVDFKSQTGAGTEAADFNGWYQPMILGNDSPQEVDPRRVAGRLTWVKIIRGLLLLDSIQVLRV